MQKKWWHEKVAYQIYPKSFYDSNGDGIGDLQGIIRKLDYLKDLGVDILWLSPIFCSPLADQGYDISDYYNIDPRFGTMDDMDELIAEAKKRGMYVLMDLVVNHCSDEHEWFKKAMEDPDGEYGKYFYIEEGRNGEPPCNWRSYFGGSAWEKIPGTDRFYLHSFHKKQPDLNWENPTLRREIYKMINWWLDKGLGGFRIDAIINIKKELPFRDYEPDREDGMCSIKKMLAEAEGVGEFLLEMKEETFKKYDAFAVGEVFDEKPEEIAAFIGDDGYFSSMFDFEETLAGKSDRGWYDCRHVGPDEYRDCCFKSQRKTEGIGFLSNIIENHDEPRGVSHYIPQGDCNDTSKKMLGGISFMLKGLPFIYQGQELGMENTTFASIDEVDDISTIDEYHVALEAGFTPEEALKIVSEYSRDNARTPFQWDDGPNAGFTAGSPWLKVNPNYKEINAQSQTDDEDSVLAFYKQLIALRKNPAYRETVVYGTCEPAFEDRSRIMAFYRKGPEKTLLVIANFQNQEQPLTLPKTCKKILINNYPDLISDGRNITLKGYQLVVLEM